MSGHSDNNELQAAGGDAGSDGPFRPLKDSGRPPAVSGEQMHRGWVKLWRKWRDHEMASDANATLVFLHLLTEARRTPKKNRRFGYVLQRGQCDLTLKQLAERTALSVPKVREALARLCRYETIQRSTPSGKQPAITTIVNFDTYNPDAPTNNTQNNTQHVTSAANQPQHPENVERVENTTAREPKSSLPKEHHGAPEPVVAEKDYRASFDRFWEIFPRKSSKGRAWQYWDRMTAAEREKALKYAEAYAEVFKAATDDRRPFFKSAPSWLEGRCWEDDPHEWCLQANVDPRKL